MADRDYLIKSNKYSLPELAEAASKMEKSELYDLVPCRIEFIEDFEWDGHKISKGDNYLMVSGDNGCIYEFLNDLPKEMRSTIIGYNTLDMEIQGYGKCITEHEYSTEKFIDELNDAQENVQTGNNISELQKILEQYGMGKEAQQISLLLEQMQAMQQNYNTVFQELKTVRNQLDQLQNTSQPETQSAIVNQLAAFEGSVQNQYKKLQDVGRQVNEKAGTLIQRFKEIGIKALNNICQFLGIKENLIKMRDIAQSNAAETKRAIEKIDSIGNEVKKAGVHFRNIGRAVTGRELIDPSSREQLKIFKNLKAHYGKNLDAFEKRTEKLNASIEKFDKLEKAADKASVRAKLASNKKAVEANDASEPKIEKERPPKAEPAR